MACDTYINNDRVANKPPRTRLTVEEINREGENRLSAQIKISWWGDDPDGFVVGFEYEIQNSGQWSFTTRNDSTFVLPITPGEQFADVVFRVRAVDNEDARDPNPASVTFPIRNTPPTIRFNNLELPPDSSYQLVSFGWVADDVDGVENLLRYEVALNDTTTWTPLDLVDNFISLNLPRNASGNTPTMFLGRSYRSTTTTIGEFKLNQDNTFFIRSLDQALAKSEVREHTWYVRAQTSNILVLNDIGVASGRAAIMNQYLTAMQELGFTSYDVINITDGSADGGFRISRSAALPRVTAPTLQQAIAQWDRIIWISNDLTRNIGYAPEFIGPFLQAGGKVFVTIPVRRLPVDDPTWSFLPVAGLEPIPPFSTGFILEVNRDITPLEPTNALVLRNTQSYNLLAPIIAPAGAKRLYDADIQRATAPFGRPAAYDGNKTIAVKSAEGNVVYYGLSLHLTNGNNNFRQALGYFLIDELGF